MSDFPSLDANASAKAVLDDCSLLYQKGESDTKAGKYDEQAVLSMLGAIPEAQYNLYRYAYRTGRTVAYSKWDEGRIQAFSEEAGRAIATGLDDALAGRGAYPGYTPKTAGWSADDISSLSYLYTAAYKEGETIPAEKKSTKGLWVLAGLVAATGIAGTMYITSRKAGPVQPLEQERYANPSRSPGMTVQSLLFNREAWDVGMAKRWAKNHNYRSDDVDVKPNTIRMRQADPKHFQKKTMRTIQFGDDSGIQAVVARPKR